MHDGLVNCVMKAAAPRNRTALSLHDALGESPAMQRLGAMIGESQTRFKRIAHLLPKHAGRSIQPGPIDDRGWCLLVTNSATAAKLRQVIPDIEQHLSADGLHTPKVRVKVIKPST